jgi:ArsR family transcriptional regulator
MAKLELDFNKITKASEILKAIAHPLRLKTISVLSDTKELNVNQLVFELKAEQSLVSHHLSKMQKSGVLMLRRDGKNIYYSLADKSMTKVLKCISKCKNVQ